MEWLLPFVGVYIATYILILWLNKEAVKAVNNYKAEVTTEIKVACIKNAIAEGVDPGAVISFIDNDLKLVMENYFGNIIKIVKSSAFSLHLQMPANYLSSI